MPQTLQKQPKTPKAAPSTKTYRFDARLSAEQKLLIQRAADLEGRSMTDFVLQSAQAAAEQAIERRALMVLTARDSEAFAEAILHPPAPGPVLRRAAREYRQKIGRA